MDLETLRRLCVSSFRGSNTKTRLFGKLLRLLSVVDQHRLKVILWIDGSFVTRKPNPRDLDVVLFIEYDETVDPESQKGQILSELEIDKVTGRYGLDLWICPIYPNNHPEYWFYETQREYWQEEFGKDRNELPKGILELRRMQ